MLGFLDLPFRSRRYTSLALKKSPVFFDDGINQRHFTDTRRSDEYQRFVFQGGRIKRVEVLFCVHKNIVLIKLLNELFLQAWKEGLLIENHLEPL